MMEKQILRLKYQLKVRDLQLIQNEKENIIKSLERSTLENNWCYKNGCTTCGAHSLRANITFFSIQKCTKDLDLNFENRFGFR